MKYQPSFYYFKLPKAFYINKTFIRVVIVLCWISKINTTPNYP